MKKNIEYSELLKVNEISDATAKLLFKMGIKTPNDLSNADANDIFKSWGKFKNDGEISYNSSLKSIKKWITNAKSDDIKYYLAKIRYESLKERTFSDALKMLLIDKLIINKEPNDFSIDEVSFKVSKETLNYLKDAFKNMTLIRINNRIIKEWRIKNINKEKEIKKSYSNYFNYNLPFESFKIFYGKDSDTRQCKYCQINEKQIEDLLNKGKIITKRIYSRGRSLEIDKTDPNGKYTIGNIELCCYWCNNAKTDEFDEKEFSKIGKLIKEVWEERLGYKLN